MRKAFFIIIIFLCVYSFLQAQTDSVITYYDNGNLKSVINYADSVREGEARFYYDNGNIKQQMNYVNGRVDGLVKDYYENGNLKQLINLENGKREGPTSNFNKDGKFIKDVFYERGKLYIEPKEEKVETKKEVASNKAKSLKSEIKKSENKINKDKNGLPLPPPIKEQTFKDDPAYFRNVEVLPEPIGGMQVIQKKLYYPQNAIDNGIEGTVKILAYIDRFGEVTEAKVDNGIGYGCDESARIAVYYTKFKPGLLRGEPVNVKMIIPVVFKIKKDE